jgi:vacuolar-type H+-ATPase subunit I/STV1
MANRLEKIASYEEQIAQLMNRKKQEMQKHKQEERKARTRRLIQRGAILEGFIPEAETYTEDEIQAALKETIGSDFGRKALRRAKQATANTTAPPRAETKTDSTDNAPAKTEASQQSAPALSGVDGGATGTG